MNEKQKEIAETIKAECEKNEDYQKGFITGMFYAAHISKGITNFDRITATPEALAEFISKVSDVCFNCGCRSKSMICKCMHKQEGRCAFCTPECLKWLKQESE